MKATTKAAITGVAVIMLAGAGIWMSYHREEKSVPESNEVKVERRVSVRAPAMVTSRPEKKEEDDFTFEEFNRLLDELFDQTPQSEEEKGSSSRANEEKTGPEDNGVGFSNTGKNTASSPEGEEVRGDIGDDGLSELIQKILDLAAEYRAVLEEYKAAIATSSPGREELWWKLEHLEWKAGPLFVEYHLRTGDTAAFEPGGWIDSLGVLKAAKMERDADGVWHVQWLPGKYLWEKGGN